MSPTSIFVFLSYRRISTTVRLAMPMIRVATNIPESAIPDDFEINLTNILAESMGKPKERIMIEIDAGKRMMHGATAGPVCHIAVKSIGCVGKELNIQHTERVTDFVNRVLNVPNNKHTRDGPKCSVEVLMEFHDLTPHQVGFNGTTVADAEAKRIVK